MATHGKGETEKLPGLNYVVRVSFRELVTLCYVADFRFIVFLCIVVWNTVSTDTLFYST